MTTFVNNDVASGAVVYASDHNEQGSRLASVLNGNLDNNNIKAGAAIATSKLADDKGISAAKLQYGTIRNRQGGTAGDASYGTSGTTNTDTSAKAIFMQVGSIGTATGADTTVTFPTAYLQIPQIFLSVNGNNPGTGPITQNAFATLVSKSATGFTLRTFNTSGTQSDQNVAWLAVGQ